MRSILALPLLLAPAVLCAQLSPPTLMTSCGKLLISEDFSKAVEQAPPGKATPGKPATGWRLRPGQWEFVDRAMKGTELAEDKHGAVARFPFPFKDAVIQYEVRLDGCKATTFSVNDAKDHVCRAMIDEKGFGCRKDDNDHEGPDKAVDFGKVEMPIKPGQWKTVIIEILGEEMVTQIDKKAVYGSDPLIATDKANFGFTVSGDGASFRNLRIWEAKPNLSWSSNKAKLQKKK